MCTWTDGKATTRRRVDNAATWIVLSLQGARAFTASFRSPINGISREGLSRAPWKIRTNSQGGAETPANNKADAVSGETPLEKEAARREKKAEKQRRHRRKKAALRVRLRNPIQ